MLVEVTRAERGTFQPSIVATGTVVPEQDIILSPRVSGEILSRAPAFTPGGTVGKGEALLQIDPADYKNTLEMRQTDLLQARADLEIELGRQDVARRDYALFNDTLTAENEALVLRKPQLNAARSHVKAAEVAVKQAKLDLERTTIRAPFDAYILNRNANIGSQVSPGDNLGRLVGLDTYWVVATIPLAKLRWLNFADNNRSAGSGVQIRNRTAWEAGEFRVGYIDKLVGALEDQTRMARVLINVPDPLAKRKSNRDLPPLMIGAFVEVRITAREIPDVIRLNRDYLRKDDAVWVMQGDTLSIRDVEIVFRDADYAYISSGLEENDLVVTTNLSTVVQGARLRLEGQSDTSRTPDSMRMPDQSEHGSPSPGRQ